MNSPARAYISEERAREILLAAETAWNARDLRALKELFVEDFFYWTNWGGPNDGERRIYGRQEYIRNLAAIRDSRHLTIRLVSCHVEGDRARARFDSEWCDPDTGLRHVFTTRNIVTFEGDRIARLEVYQDASAMTAFRALIDERKK